jgi:putative ABC transport system permease protein
MNLFTELKEGFSFAWDSVRANKMRSALTTLGIVIGIVTVTLMGTAINGMNDAFHKSISVLGADTFFVGRFSWLNHNEADWIKSQRRREFTLDQTRQIARQLTMARAIAPYVVMGQPVVYKSRSSSRVMVIGTTDEYIITSGFSIAQGRFLTPSESEGGRPVCIIGNDVATNLFIGESPLGSKIKVGERTLEVIGVLDKQGSFLGMESLDNEVIVPVAQFLIGYTRNPDFQIQVKAKDINSIDEAKEELRGVLRKVRHVAPGDPDDFAINQQEQFVTMFNKVAGTIGIVGLLITGLSLFVGGIGIMNIMFVSVAERTREIGVRKAIGAKRRTILLQFLIEAATICTLGGLIGLGITYLLTLVVARFLPVNMSLPVVLAAIVVSILTGVVSGFLPAWRAARMNPVDALRNE